MASSDERDLRTGVPVFPEPSPNNSFRCARPRMTSGPAIKGRWLVGNTESTWSNNCSSRSRRLCAPLLPTPPRSAGSNEDPPLASPEAPNISSNRLTRSRFSRALCAEAPSPGSPVMSEEAPLDRLSQSRNDPASVAFRNDHPSDRARSPRSPLAGAVSRNPRWPPPSPDSSEKIPAESPRRSFFAPG